MAIINCPGCNKKISDKAKSCHHCDLTLVGLDDEKRSSLKKVSMAEASQKLTNQSMIAMLLFCGGFLFLYYQDAQPGTWQYITAITGTAIGFILYIITRVRLVFLKKSNK